MTKQLTPLIEQFRLTEGRWQGAPPNQAAVRPPQGSNKGNLFILVEVEGLVNNLESVEQQLVALIRDTYYPSSRGVTASLRRAVSVANHWLYQHNSNAEVDKPLYASVAIAVSQEEDIFLAQVGTSAIFSHLNDFVYRYPSHTNQFGTSKPDPTTSVPKLGVQQVIQPNLFHLETTPNDIIILTDTNLGQNIVLDRLAQIARSHPEASIGQFLIESIDLLQGSGLVLRIAETDVQATGQASAAIEREPINKELLPIRLPFLARAKLLTDAKAMAEARGFHFTLPAFLQTPKATTSGNNTANMAIDWSAISKAILTSLALLGSSLQALLRLVLPAAQAEDSSTPQAISQEDASQKVQKTAKQSLSPTMLRYLAIGLPLAAVLLPIFMYWQRDYQQEQAYLEALTLAQQKYEQAIISAPEETRILLHEAELSLSEAIAIKGNQHDITVLQSEIANRRDTIDSVQRLLHIPVLKHYTEPGTALSRVIVQGVEIYVLDQSLHRVYRHELDDTGDALLPRNEAEILVQQGWQVETQLVSPLVDMVWMPTGNARQTSDLLILTQSGLLEFNPSWGTSLTPLNTNPVEISPLNVGSYFGKFYIAEAQTNQIYRYTPSLDGYDRQPELYFAPDLKISLAGVVDMAIDGAIYLLYQNGEVAKFLGGRPDNFQIRGLDIALNNPTSLFTAPDDLVQYLYIADAGNQRIVQLTKEGQFIRQFKPRVGSNITFNDLQAIFVDEIGEKMFILNSNSLYAPNLPILQ